MAGRFRNQAALLFQRSVFFQETPPQQHRSLRSRSYLYWSTLSIPGVQNGSEENSATAVIGNCAELQLGGYKRGQKNISTTTHQTTAVILSGVQSARVQNTINSGYVTRHHWMRSFASGGGDVVEAVVPFMGESVSDGTLATFLKKPGDSVEVDEAIAQIETDKVTVDVTSPEAGIIEKFVAKEGDTVVPGTKVAVITKAAEGSKPIASAKETALTPPSQPSPSQQHQVAKESEPSPTAESADKGTADKTSESALPSPKTSPSEPQLPPKERERRIPMTRLRKRVATCLKDSQNTFAMLTTFNEIDMTNLMQLRSEYKDSFQEKHGVKLGFMSGFIKGAVCALQDQPIVNAVIDGDDIIYRDYIDISIAVGTPKGLVVPVIRSADKLNFAEVEKTINALAKKANTGTISIDEMAGGTFTISNGGVYGSLLSTPIINPPQSAILGMHSIQNRPMVVKGNIVARPMMYVALTYDHRLIDGREAVYFLRRIKDVVEDPRKLLLDL